jgi:hypothetical protein
MLSALYTVVQSYNFDLIYLLNLETELIFLRRLNVILIRLQLEKLPLE